MQNHVVQHEWVQVNGTCIAVEAIDAFGPDENNDGTVVYLRGGNVLTVLCTVDQFKYAVENSGRS